MRIPEQQVNEIRQKADIVDIISQYLPLEKKGKEYAAVCPFHDDHDPSMHVSPDKQIYKCFVCGAGGDVFKFVSQYEKVSFVQAVEKVAARIHYPLQIHSVPTERREDPRQNLYRTLELFTAYCRYELASRDGLKAREYLDSRKFTKPVLETFQIGYAPERSMVGDYLQARIQSVRDLEQTGLIQIGTSTLRPLFFERIVIPIHDPQGRPVGYTARILPDSGQKAKYINTSQTPLYNKGSLIFNYHRAADVCRQAGRLILCEGAMDVIGLAKAGLNEGIACLGTACTPEQLQLIARCAVPVAVFYDQDAAGQKAAWTFGQKALKAGIRFSIVRTQDGKDPDEIFIAHGKKRLQAAVESTVSFAEFALDYLQGVYNLKNYEDRKTFASQMEQLIRQSLDSYEQPAMFDRLSQLTGFRFESYAAGSASTRSGRKKKPVRQTPAAALSTPPVIQGRLQAEKAVLWSMLARESYIDQFQNEVGFFSDSSCEKLFLYVQNTYRNDREIDPVGLCAAIEEDDVRALLVELSEWPDFSEAIESLYADSVRKIQKDLLGAQIEEITQEIASCTELSEKVSLMKKKKTLVAKRQSLNFRKVV